MIKESMGLAEGGRANFSMGGGADVMEEQVQVQKHNQKKLHQQVMVYLTKN